MISAYTKALASIVAAVLAVLGSALTDGTVTSVELVTILIATVTAVGVYLVPNLPGGVLAYAKGIVAFLGAGLSAVATVVGSGGFAAVTPSEWITVVLAALGGIGVTVLPNRTARAVNGLSTPLRTDGPTFRPRA